MALKDTCKTLRNLLESIQGDLEKAEAGNKAAAQRVRTSTIRLEKAAKLYRKESIKADKNGFMKKAKAAAKKKGAPAVPQRKASKKLPPAQTQNVSAPAKKPTPPTAKRKPAPKAPAAPTKRATAKLPKRKKR